MRRVLLLLALAACGTKQPPQKPLEAPQLLTSVVDDWTSTKATLQLWTRDGDHWTKDGEPWQAVTGATGLAWGKGLVDPHRDGPVKHEGDKKAPAGVFALPATYGYAAAPPPGTKLPYHQVDDTWECVDDGASKQYNHVLQRTPDADWHSSEHMKRPDALYTWVIDVAHNTGQVAGGGSCIFLHVWRGPDSTTVGCTAMEEPKLAALIGKLQPGALFVQLPRAEYAALAPAWGLPSM